MESKSSIKETWKLFSLGTLLGCFFLLLFIDQIHQNTSFLSIRNSLLPLTPKVLDSSNGMIIPLEPLNTTFDDNLLEPSNTTLDDYNSLGPSNTIFDDNLLEPSNTTLDNNPLGLSNIKLDDNLLDHSNITVPYDPKDEQRFSVDDEKTVNKTKTKCNMFDGRWVYMPEKTPNYDSTTCPFLEEKMSCQKNGRPDFDYEKWRWEGTDCDVPLFNGIDMMERLRNKRMIIAGDSLNRNMWESLACLLYTSISPTRAEVKAESTVYKVFKAKDYNFTVEFYWSPFLIEFDRNHRSGKKVIVLDKLSPNSEGWRGADIMVFNSGHWWAHTGKFKSWDLFQYGEELKEEMPIETAYKRGMRTWAKWIKKNVDPKKTTVFFRGISAEHTLRQYDQWCYNVTQPMDKSYVSVYPKVFVETIEGLVRKMSKLQVKYLNITKLSESRIDAHPSVFRSQGWRTLTEKFQDNISLYADCSHWCLPGVPDTWNRLLYASIFFQNEAMPKF